MAELVETQAYRWDHKSLAFVFSPADRVKFLKGPVPWSWIKAAARLPGSALAVGLTLWRLSGATKSKTVRLANSETEALGVGRSAKSRALVALERAGLVIVERRIGCLPKVTILEV